jgi:hypothetical protein
VKAPLFRLLNTPETLIATSVKNPEALEVLTPWASVAHGVPTHRVLIAHPDQLHKFVQSVPPLAWELLEYATEPLEIVYPERKPTLNYPDQPTAICVRWVKQPQLLRFVQKEGPLWAVHPAAIGGDDLMPIKNIDCTSKRYPYRRVRTVAVFADDTFRFLR